MTEFDQRLRQTEAENAALKLAAGSRAVSGDLTPNMAEVMNNQNKLLEAIVNQPKREPSSTIKVEPRVNWPKLGDDGHGGNEVEEFFEKFEDICALANNGQGMRDTEMLVALKNALYGSRLKIYENVHKSQKEALKTEEGLQNRRRRTSLRRLPRH